MTQEYRPESIETKWQKIWSEQKLWEVTEDRSKPKYYVLEMFPYPSGKLHMGHVRNYSIGDAIARFRRAAGYNVLHPMGWDAFGLPAENAAIKHGVHPETWTLENIIQMRAQFQRLGFGFDWSREITTCLPEYYKFEQEIFIKMFEHGLVYKKASSVNWCPSCATVLANEQVEDGKCWRCDSDVTTRELEQWFLKISQYADELLRDLDTLPGWPDRVKSMQRHWIGRSEGAEIKFRLESDAFVKERPTDSDTLTVFTTRPDTLFGATYLALAPEHPWALALVAGRTDEKDARAFIERCRRTDKTIRTAEDAPKEGFFTGAYARHPLTDARLPIYLANFVVTDYGTGALMAVPAHDVRDFAFAQAYQLPIVSVIAAESHLAGEQQELPFTQLGILSNSGAFSGLTSELAKHQITDALAAKQLGRATVQFRLRDWGLSRQRYWGAPIPMIICPTCGTVPVPREQLPVVLPKDLEISGQGNSPLQFHPDFAQTTCPKCHNPKARRETDTMDTFMESSWYYLRYTSPWETSAPFSAEAVQYWLGVDQYIGGIEHATMHLLYFRFFHKVLRDLGYFPDSLQGQDRNEPVRALLNQGIVYKDGAKMSKSKGNVVEPNEIIEKFGADTGRLFSLFAAPPEKVLEWSDQGAEGCYRFLGRVWRLVQNNESLFAGIPSFAGTQAQLTIEASRKLRAKTHQTIQKVTGDFANGYHFNTAIAAIMELVNECYLYEVNLAREESRAVLKEATETTLRLLHPFAPHITEELWSQLGHTQCLTGMILPTLDPVALVRDTIRWVVQVNGKWRAEVPAGVQVAESVVVDLAKSEPKVASQLEGKTLVKTIVVPKKLINFVVKD